MSKSSFSDLNLCPETCLGSFCSSDVSRSSLVFLKRAILTPISLSSRSILTGHLPSLSQVYALSPSLATMLLRHPRPAFAVDGVDNSYQPLYRVVSRPLLLYTKAVTELDWNLTLINPPTLADGHGSTTITRPMSLYVENQLRPQRRDEGGERVMVVGGFLAVPNAGSESSKLKKSRKDIDAWMG